MAARRSIVACALGAVMMVPTPAFGYGPKAELGDPAVVACIGEDLSGGVAGRQIEAGIIAGGGPKSVQEGPTNCDHFWQDPEGLPVIGNGHWPPPPYAG
jgi:hypothetical protein